MSRHDAVVAKISNQFRKKGWWVQVRGNNLPSGSSRSQAIYRPDILVTDGDGQIAWIVEVETSDAGKGVAGAVILADACIEIERAGPKQRENPKLLFVFYNPSANLELAPKRLKPLEHRIEHMKIVKPMTEREAMETIWKLREPKRPSPRPG
jgi:hypothetical protein